MPEEPTRILITGANGFVGRHLLTQLLEPGSAVEGDPSEARILAAVQPEHRDAAEAWAQLSFAGARAAQIRWAGIDITDSQAMAEGLASFRPQYIYHLAARASGADADREAVFMVNVQGTRNLLEAAASLTPLPRVLAISTSYVYGDTDPARPAREDDPLAPLGRYGAYADSKREMERVALDYADFVVIARAFSHTGPGQSSNFAIPSFARQLARIERGEEAPQLRVGNLEARRELLDVRDVARAYRLLMSRGVASKSYNVSTGSPWRMRDLLDCLRALCSSPTQVVVDPARLRPADIACSTGDYAALRAATGWRPETPLETTLRDTLDYWRKQIDKDND